MNTNTFREPLGYNGYIPLTFGVLLKGETELTTTQITLKSDTEEGAIPLDKLKVVGYGSRTFDIEYGDFVDLKSFGAIWQSNRLMAADNKSINNVKARLLERLKFAKSLDLESIHKETHKVVVYVYTDYNNIMAVYRPNQKITT